MKQKDLMLILIPALIITVLWVIFNIYHNYVTSTIKDPLTYQIKAINGTFDKNIIESLKKRNRIEPAFGIITSITATISSTQNTVQSDNSSNQTDDTLLQSDDTFIQLDDTTDQTDNSVSQDIINSFQDEPVTPEPTVEFIPEPTTEVLE